MATTFPLSTLAASVTAEGISAPSYADILSSLKATFRLIYGDDAYLEADSQDGQLLAAIALAIHDCNQASIAVYNSFSPQTAVGNGLSNVVKINHMARQLATSSQVNVTIAGVVGTTIVNGQVSDVAGNRWDLPASVTIPIGGSVIVTATAHVPGNIAAASGTVTKIMTPVAGWQSVTNLSAATPGSDVESDAALRLRQTQAPALNGYTVLQGLLAALNALSGVSYLEIYENDTNVTDSNGIPAHALAVVIKGGDATAIAQTIYDFKGPGVATYGTTTINITDDNGVLRAIHYTVPTEIPIKATVSLTAGVGYNTNIANAIKAAVAASVNALRMGVDVVVNRLTVPALLDNAPDSFTYTLVSVQAGLVSGSVGTANIVIGYAEKAVMSATDVTITLV